VDKTTKVPEQEAQVSLSCGSPRPQAHQLSAPDLLTAAQQAELTQC